MDGGGLRLIELLGLRGLGDSEAPTVRSIPAQASGLGLRCLDKKEAVGPIYSEGGGRNRPGFQPSKSCGERIPGAMPQAGIGRAVGPSISKWFRKGDYARMSVPGRAVGGFRREGLIVILRMLWHSASLLLEGLSVDLR